MTKKEELTKPISVNGAELLKQLAKAKAVNLKKAKAYQLPVKAHTSNTAKLAIGIAVIQSSIALTVLTAAIIHKVAYKKNADYRAKVDRKAQETDLWVDDAKKDVADVADKAEAKVEEVTKTVRSKLK